MNVINSPKGKFQDEIMRTRPRGSWTISALESNAIDGSGAYIKVNYLVISGFTCTYFLHISFTC